MLLARNLFSVVPHLRSSPQNLPLGVIEDSHVRIAEILTESRKAALANECNFLGLDLIYKKLQMHYARK